MARAAEAAEAVEAAAAALHPPWRLPPMAGTTMEGMSTVLPNIVK